MLSIGAFVTIVIVCATIFILKAFGVI